MSITPRQVAVAAALAALSLPALAAEDAPAVKQDCSVCNDPTFPEIASPAPALVFRAQPGGETDPTPFDPTQPEVREPAPALHLERDRSEGRVAHAKR